MNQTVEQVNSGGLNRFFSQVYLKVALGVGISTLVSFFLLTVGQRFLINFMSHSMAWLVLCVVEVLLVLFAPRKAYSGNSSGTMLLYVAYSLINGVTLTVALAFVNQARSIAEAFLVTSLMFIAMSIYGRTTRKDLSVWRNFLVGLGLGVIITVLVNFFLGSTAISIFCSLASVVMFSLYMAYDTQMVIALYQSASAHNERGLATFGAMSLYMDLIGMFINLLQLFDFWNSDN